MTKEENGFSRFVLAVIFFSKLVEHLEIIASESGPDGDFEYLNAAHANIRQIAKNFQASGPIILKIQDNVFPQLSVVIEVKIERHITSHV